jgi:hypothetical protein
MNNNFIDSRSHSKNLNNSQTDSIIRHDNYNDQPYLQNTSSTINQTNTMSNKSSIDSRSHSKNLNNSQTDSNEIFYEIIDQHVPLYKKPINDKSYNSDVIQNHQDSHHDTETNNLTISNNFNLPKFKKLNLVNENNNNQFIHL